MRNFLIHTVRRFAVGIEVQASEVQAVILSRRLIASAALRIEHLGRSALPIGAVSSAEFIDPNAIAAAIANALNKSGVALQRLRAVMALPSTAVWLREVALTQFAATHPIETQLNSWLDTLEPEILTEAERLFQVEATALAIDWFCESDSQPTHLIIAAAPRQYLETRIEAAAHVGLRLTAVDSEKAAALRACRFAAMQTLHANALYSVIWIGQIDTFIWLIQQHRNQQERHFSTTNLSTANFIDELHAFADIHHPQQVWISATSAMLDTLSLTTHAISAALRCPAVIFDPTRYCKVSTPLSARIPSEAASFSVAFGLALRGVLT